MNSFARFDAGYNPVTSAFGQPQPAAPQSAEPEVPSFVNEPMGAPRVSPFAGMQQEIPAQPMPQQQNEMRQEENRPRSFMDGIPAYMRRK